MRLVNDLTEMSWRQFFRHMMPKHPYRTAIKTADNGKSGRDKTIFATKIAPNFSSLGGWAVCFGVDCVWISRQVAGN